MPGSSAVPRAPLMAGSPGPVLEDRSGERETRNPIGTRLALVRNPQPRPPGRGSRCATRRSLAPHHCDERGHLHPYKGAGEAPDRVGVGGGVLGEFLGCGSEARGRPGGDSGERGSLRGSGRTRLEPRTEPPDEPQTAPQIEPGASLPQRPTRRTWTRVGLPLRHPEWFGGAALTFGSVLVPKRGRVRARADTPRARRGSRGARPGGGRKIVCGGQRWRAPAEAKGTL